MTVTPLPVLEQLKKSQSIATPTLNNARELGGYVMQDGRVIRHGRLLRSVQLADAAPEDLRVLREQYDLRLVLDMRADDDLVRAPDPEIPGVRWVHDPIIDFSLWQDPAAKLQGHQEEMDRSTPEGQLKAIAYFLTSGIDAERMYAHYLQSEFGQAGFRLFFREILNCPEGAVLWHCFTGKDRTGIGAGLLLEALGADWDTILADYELSALFFTERIRWAEDLARGAGYEEEMVQKIAGLMAGIHVNFLRHAWDYMTDTCGSPLSYIRQVLGITPEEIEILRDRYLE